MPTRREFLAGAVATIAVACTGGDGDNPPPSSGTIESLMHGAPELSVLGLGAGALGGSPSDPVQTGRAAVTFDLSVSQGIVEGGQPQLFVAPRERARAIGPFRAVWTPFTAYEKTGDHSPKSPIPGVYTADIHVAQPGLWTIAVIGPGGRSQGVGVTHAYFADDVVAAVGSKAKRTPTPVATTPHALREVCTRRPPCPMHAISLADAIGNGKPTVAVFSTPLLCESRLCGPVTDEAMLVQQQRLGGRANFVHVEEFPPGPDLKPDAGRQSAPFRAWGFRTEPWTIVIDAQGVIRTRFEGSVTAPILQAALRPLL